jgi:hypothetical protein
MLQPASCPQLVSAALLWNHLLKNLAVLIPCYSSVHVQSPGQCNTWVNTRSTATSSTLHTMQPTAVTAGPHRCGILHPDLPITTHCALRASGDLSTRCHSDGGNHYKSSYGTPNPASWHHRKRHGTFHWGLVTFQHPPCLAKANLDKQCHASTHGLGVSSLPGDHCTAEYSALCGTQAMQCTGW